MPSSRFSVTPQPQVSRVHYQATQGHRPAPLAPGPPGPNFPNCGHAAGRVKPQCLSPDSPKLYPQHGGGRWNQGPEHAWTCSSSTHSMVAVEREISWASCPGQLQICPPHSISGWSHDPKDLAWPGLDSSGCSHAVGRVKPLHLSRDSPCQCLKHSFIPFSFFLFKRCLYLFEKQLYYIQREDV